LGPMIQVRDLILRHKKLTILDGIGFNALPEEVTTIFGPNASGKTSLIKCINGTWNFDEGTITLDGQRIFRLKRRGMAKLLATVPQEHHPPFPYTTLEVVLMGRLPHVGLFSWPSQRDKGVAVKALEAVGIGHLAERPYTQISGGERQLTLIARSLAQEPKILLLDEPTAHLDFKNQISVLRVVRDLAKKEGLTVLLTLHDPNLSLIFSDKVALLNKGKMVAFGKPSSVITRENLKNVYDLDVDFLSQDGLRFIYPKIPGVE